jgi:hypothetical protein
MADLALRANIKLFPTEEHGRRNPIRTGYRPSLWFGGTTPQGEQDLHSAVIRLRESEEVRPGDTSRAEIVPVAVGTWPPIQKGRRFDLIEGSRLVGHGEFVESTSSLDEADLRLALRRTFESWVAERFNHAIAHREQTGNRLSPDLVLRFRDPGGDEEALIGEIVVRGPQKRDVERIARLMDRQEASFGVIIGLGDASPGAEATAYEHGRVEVSAGRWIPRIRILSTRSLFNWDPHLIPDSSEPELLEVIE